MKNYLLAIGCDEHSSEKLNDLSGANNDATDIYNCLVASEYSIYDKSVSQLLKSPILAEVRNALEYILLDSGPSEVFTLFFAGHGGVLDGTYYLCLSDSKPDRMSFSALSLSEVFRMVSSSGVRHVNLIIDACNTGGLVNDLASIIKPDLIGSKGSFGISILAASASDEAASEIEGQGLLTGSLIKYIDGSKRLTDSVEFLDLVSVGRELSTEFIEHCSPQTPSSWGFNLYGPSIFAKNPFYTSEGDISTYRFSYIPPASRLGLMIKESKKEFWAAFENLDDMEGEAQLLSLFRKLVASTENIEDVLALIAGIGYRFAEQVEANSSLKKLELICVLLTSLYPYIGEERANAEVDRLISELDKYGEISLDDLILQIEKCDSFLVYKDGIGFDVMANYYYLPIRISKILGMVSLLVLVDDRHSSKALKLVRLIET